MSKKRSQRKNSNYNYRPGQKAGEDPQALQENSRTKKFSPAARNLLFVDLIFLAVCQMMESGGLLDDVLSAWLTLVGLILLLVAVGTNSSSGGAPSPRSPRGPGAERPMKREYRRSEPLFSQCGLNCGLCPMYHIREESHCPGCGGRDGHPAPYSGVPVSTAGWSSAPCVRTGPASGMSRSRPTPSSPTGTPAGTWRR